MPAGTSQIPLKLPIEAASGREDLIESPANTTAVSMVDAWPQWPGPLMILAGPVGSGKTHISNIWAAMAAAHRFECSVLSSKPEDIVELASGGGNILIEDISRELMDDAAVFHVINAVKQGKGYCLLTSRTWPRDWGVSLPDLESRLRAAQVVELLEPDDALLSQVIFKLFADRQLVVDRKIIDYCVLRMERSLESANRLVEIIDADALARSTRITRSMASRALDQLGMN